MNRIVQWVCIWFGFVFLLGDDVKYVIWCGFLLLALVIKERRCGHAEE